MRTEDYITEKIIKACINVHKALGPGLLESIYEKALSVELFECGLDIKTQVEIPVIYKNKPIGVGFRADVIVENTIILELKSVEKITSLHWKQLLTYLKLTGMPIGLLLNFNVPIFKDGIKRIINTSPSVYSV
jgi:GxxExxY protein